MSTTTASDAHANLYRLIDEAAESHQPVRITGKRHNAILLLEEDWESIQETLYLTSIPGIRQSIIALRRSTGELARRLHGAGAT